MKKFKRGKFKGKTISGFTLVELIVVLVILAILAAILVPALLGYIDRAKEKQDLLDAKNCLTVIQAQLSEVYGKNGGVVPENGTPILNPNDYWENKRNSKTSVDDINATAKTKTENGGVEDNNTFARKILTTMDSKGNNDNKKEDPYCIVFAVGSNAINTDTISPSTTTHDKYTVYFLFYKETKSSTPLFYYDGRWSTSYPREADGSEFLTGQNIVKSGKLKGKRLQFYTISNESYRDLPNNRGFGTPEFWNWVKSF